MSSARSYMILTGLPDFHASSAAWPAIIDGILFLAAEAAAGLHLDDAHLVGGQTNRRSSAL